MNPFFNVIGLQRLISHIMTKQAIINISEEQRTALKNGCRNGSTPFFPDEMPYGGPSVCFEQFSCMSGDRTMYQRAIRWIKRFQSDGMEGLRNRPGNGHKRIISTQKDKEAVREAMRKHLQSVSIAGIAFE